MKIGILLPNLLMTKQNANRIFAPKELCIWLADGLVKKGHTVYLYTGHETKTLAQVIGGDPILEDEQLESMRDVYKYADVYNSLSKARQAVEYELDFIPKAYKHAEEHGVDIMHVYLTTYNYYFEHFFQTPTVYTLHDPISHKKTFEAFRFSHFNHNNYVAISDSQKDYYIKEFQFNFITRVYHGVDTLLYKDGDVPKDGLIWMGRYLPEKGILESLQIAIEMQKKIEIASSPDFLESPFYINDIKPLLNNPLVIQNQFLDEPQKIAMYQRAKATFFPIKWDEPFGMVMIESMACGTPVIGYARGSVPEVIIDGVTGFIVNESEEHTRGNFIIKQTGVEGLKEAVKRIYAMPSYQYQEMRKACREHIQKHFNLEKMVDEYEKVYEKLLMKN